MKLLSIFIVTLYSELERMWEEAGYLENLSQHFSRRSRKTVTSWVNTMKLNMSSVIYMISRVMFAFRFCLWKTIWKILKTLVAGQESLTQEWWLSHLSIRQLASSVIWSTVKRFRAVSLSISHQMTCKYLSNVL